MYLFTLVPTMLLIDDGHIPNCAAGAFTDPSSFLHSAGGLEGKRPAFFTHQGPAAPQTSVPSLLTKTVSSVLTSGASHLTPHT